MTDPERTMNWYLPHPRGLGLETVLLSHSDDRCQLLLACGHWSERMSTASSTFDFPMDAVRCRNCDDDRYLDIRLQAVILERNRRDADDT